MVHTLITRRPIIGHIVNEQLSFHPVNIRVVLAMGGHLGFLRNLDL